MSLEQNCSDCGRLFASDFDTQVCESCVGRNLMSLFEIPTQRVINLMELSDEDRRTYCEIFALWGHTSLDFIGRQVLAGCEASTSSSISERVSNAIEFLMQEDPHNFEQGEDFEPSPDVLDTSLPEFIPERNQTPKTSWIRTALAVAAASQLAKSSSGHKERVAAKSAERERESAIKELESAESNLISTEHNLRQGLATPGSVTFARHKVAAAKAKYLRTL
jgi:hypothetical protein